MKTLPLLLIVFGFYTSKAQKLQSIHVNLYTDSLKKGTYNYINIDGLLSNGKYVPLDSNQLVFQSSYGKFYGNSLFIDRECKTDRVTINVCTKKEPLFRKEFVMYIKKKEDDQKLLTSEEMLEQTKKGKK